MEFVEETLNQLEEEIVKLNQEQLVETKFSDGSLLPYYSPITIERKKEEGTYISPNYRWALIDYGDFVDYMFSKANAGKLLIGSKDKKTQTILDMVDKETGKSKYVFGLSDTQKEYLAELARPILYEKIINFLKSA
jgi:hypothetical protein